MGIFLSQPGASSFHSRAFEIIFSESSWREIGHSLSVSGFLPKLDAAGVNMYLGVKVDIGFRESKSYHEVRMIYKSLLHMNGHFIKSYLDHFLSPGSGIPTTIVHCQYGPSSVYSWFVQDSSIVHLSSPLPLIHTTIPHYSVSHLKGPMRAGLANGMAIHPDTTLMITCTREPILGSAKNWPIIRDGPFYFRVLQAGCTVLFQYSRIGSALGLYLSQLYFLVCTHQHSLNLIRLPHCTHMLLG